MSTAEPVSDLIQRLQDYSTDWRNRAASNAVVLEAISALSHAQAPDEPIAWTSADQIAWLRLPYYSGVATVDVKSRPIPGYDQPLYTHPAAPVAAPVQVKALEWEEIGSGFYRARAPLFGNIRVEKYGKRFTVCYSLPGYSDTFTPGDFATADEAKTAAQADYEQRIRSVLEERG